MFRKTPASGDGSGLRLFLKAHLVPKNKLDQQFGCVFNSRKYCKAVISGVLDAVCANPNNSRRSYSTFVFSLCVTLNHMTLNQTYLSIYSVKNEHTLSLYHLFPCLVATISRMFGFMWLL